MMVHDFGCCMFILTKQIIYCMKYSSLDVARQEKESGHGIISWLLLDLVVRYSYKNVNDRILRDLKRSIDVFDIFCSNIFANIEATI